MCKNYKLYIFMLFFILFFASAAFSKEAKIQIDGKERKYIITTPPSVDFKEPYPAIFVLHGGGGTAKQIKRKFLIEEEAHKLGFATIFPEAIDKAWNDGRPDKARIRRTGKPPADDIGFFRKIIKDLVSKGTIRQDAIFFTGASNGGMMSMRVGCEMSDTVLAIAPIIANMPVELARKCDPEYPISVMIINGTDDKLIPRLGGYVLGKKDRGQVLSVMDTIEFWLKNGHCVTVPTVEKLEADEENKEFKEVRKYNYTACADGISVHLFEIIGGGHTIPGYEEDTRPIFLKRITGSRARNIDAAVEIVNFFYKHLENKNNIEEEN